MISVNAEMGRLDRVEQLAGDDPARLAHLALAYFKAGRADEGHAIVEREIALAKRAGDRLRSLIKCSELAMWRVVQPARTGLTAEVVTASLSDLAACEAALANIDDDRARRAVQRIREFLPVVQSAGKYSRAADGIRPVAADGHRSAQERTRALRILSLSLIDQGDDAALTEAYGLTDEIFAFLIENEPPRGLAAAAYVAAIIDRALARLKHEPELFRSAVSWLEHADRWFAQSRLAYREPGVEATDESRRALDVDARKIHSLAMEILLNDLQAFSEAFDWAERSKAGVLAEILGTSSLPAPAGLSQAVLAEEARSLEALKHAANYSQAWEAQRALSVVWDRLAEVPEGAGYVALRRGTSVSYSEVRKMLAAAERELGGTACRRFILIEYVVIGDQLLTFGVSSDNEVAVVRRVPVSVSALRGEIEAMSGAPDHIRADVMAALVAHPCVAACIEPIVAWADPDDIVCVVPAGPLFHLPFHAIPVAGAPLMSRNAVFYAPSATTLRACLARRAASGNASDAAVFGDPDDGLPGARREAAAVARSLKVAPLLGFNVTNDAVLRAAATKEVVHFCGHAFFDPDDAFASGLCTAGGGIVTARELLARPGAMRLMTLSGCSTGINDVRPGDELLGFTRTMLYAGAASALVTLWPIDDEASLALMTTFYDRWLKRGESKVDALRGAQLDAIADGFTSPDQWAPFTLVGDWK